MIDNIEELEKHPKSKVMEEIRDALEAFDDAAGEETEDLTLYNDLVEAVNLLKVISSMLTYQANPLLCTGLTKRERETMSRVSDHITEFVTGVDQHLDIADAED